MIDSNIADISVIVNIYNEEHYLRQCIDSLLAQTLKPIEIILVDDGSSDSSSKICQEYTAQIPYIRCILKKNEGLVRARKAGLRVARGTYVSFVDGDDWVEPEWYETLYKAARNSGADVVVAGHKEDLMGYITPAKNIVPKGIYSEDTLARDIYSVMLNTGEFSRFGIFSYLWNKLFSREVLYPYMMNVDDRIFIGEDACSVYPALLQATKVQVLDYCGYHYRQRTNSMVKAGYERDVEKKRLSVLAKYLNRIFCASPYVDILLPQLKSYLLSQVAVRTDGLGLYVVEENFALFPFQNIPQGSEVVLYGAGTFGQHVYKRILSDNKIRINGWIDQRAEEYRKLGLNVLPISKLNELSYDYIIVAFVDEKEREIQINALCLQGSEIKKLETISISSKIKTELLDCLVEDLLK